jgi:16S rRNA (guanine966-N2)-methyltransferase
MDSKLQIISGKYRGKKLNLPDGARPTQNLARGALFNMLNGLVDIRQSVTVWDVFAGSGAFGIESLSRYEKANVILTDNAITSIETIKKNLKSIGCEATIEKTDAIAVISKFGKMADLIFVDAPYADFNLSVLFVKKLTKVVKTGAILIWEFEKIQSAPKLDDTWEILKDKTYGRARFLILKKNK